MWEVPDHLWERMVLILEAKDPRKSRGRPRTDQRRIVDGIIFKIQTGCRWNLIPKVYGSDTTIYRTLKRWLSLGIWQDLWIVLQEGSSTFSRVEWKNVALEDLGPGIPPGPSTVPPAPGESSSSHSPSDFKLRRDPS